MFLRIIAPQRMPAWLMTAVACAACGLLSGCGASTYERRLNETKKYFEYLSRLDQQLSRVAWRGAGVSIRLPKVFSEIPPPQDPADEDEERTPSFFGSARPGLAGAWIANVATDDGTAPCRLYLLSSHVLWLIDEGAEMAPDFQEIVLQQMATAFGVQAPDASGLRKIEIPRTQPRYVQARQFRTVTLRPEEPVQEVEADIEVYMRTNKDIQAVFVLIVPRKIRANEQIVDKFLLSLETLVLESKAPRQPSSENGEKTDGTAPGKSTGPGF